MDYFIKWQEAYDILKQEASKVAGDWLTIFLFAASEYHEGCTATKAITSYAGSIATPASGQDVHHPTATKIRLHGETVYEYGRRVPEKSRRVPPPLLTVHPSTTLYAWPKIT
jgi:hypothetical protein